MGGKIGIETLLLNERLLLADFVTHEILAASASERLRRDADLMMDWVTTIELVCLHHAIYVHRFCDMDIMGECHTFGYNSSSISNFSILSENFKPFLTWSDRNQASLNLRW